MSFFLLLQFHIWIRSIQCKCRTCGLFHLLVKYRPSVILFFSISSAKKRVTSCYKSFFGEAEKHCGVFHSVLYVFHRGLAYASAVVKLKALGRVVMGLKKYPVTKYPHGSKQGAFHRITEWFGSGRTLKTISFQSKPPAMVRDTFH